MIDFAKIADDKTFQRLINHLFALECNSPGFIPSSPYMGADGGWDGYYKGLYPFDNLTGLYSIQSKWTTKNFTDATKHLKGEIQKELGNAKKNKVGHLRIATNAELKVDQVKELESLNKGEVLTLYVWHRENLKLRIERQPFLKHHFFGNQQHPALVPAPVYFNTLESHLTSFSPTVIPSFENYLSDFDKFVLSPKERLFIIHSPGGYGKSHLLKELAARTHQIDPQRQAWLVRSGFASIENAIQEEVMNDRKYLLIFDDADRSFEAVEVLLAFLLKSGMDVKVILGLRTSGIYLLQEKIRDAKCSSISKQIRINEWTKEELTKLLRLTANVQQVKDEEIIVNIYPNPYLIVLAGNQLKGRVISLQELKEKIIDDISLDAEKCLKGVINEKRLIENLLFVFACIIPFRADNLSLLQKIGLELKIDSDVVKEAIERLLNVGILRKVGSTIRFSPDMKGDIYLLSHIDHLEKSFIKRLVISWMAISPKNIFVNIGSTAKYEDKNIIKEILEELMDEWIRTAVDMPGTERRRILDWVENIVFFVPKKTLDLLNAYLTLSPATETNPIIMAAWGEEKVELTTDDYGPAITELIRIPKFRKEVIDLIERIASLGLKGTFGNYKSLTLIDECISPLRNNIELITVTIGILDSWLDAPDKNRIDLLKAALSELLAATHRYSRSFLDKYEFGSKPLLNNPKVINMRNIAMEVVKKMLQSANIDLQLAALDIIENIGKNSMGTSNLHDLPLAERFITERREIIDNVTQLIKAEIDFRLLDAIEDLFIRWWLLQTPGAEQVVVPLRALPRPPEYIIFRFFTTRDYCVEDFQELEKQAPSGDRWKWFVEAVMSKRWNIQADEFIKPVEKLNKKYKTATEIASFLIELEAQISRYHSCPRPIFLNCWIKLNSQSFRDIRYANELWDKIPERFRSEIDFDLAEMLPEHVNTIAEDIFEKLPNVSIRQVETLFWLIEMHTPEPWQKWVNKLIREGNSEIRASLIYVLYFIFKKTNNIETVLDLLLDIIEKESILTHELIDKLAFIFHHLNSEMDKVKQKKDKLCSIIGRMLLDYPSFEYDTEELFGYCINNLDDMLKFIDYRLRKAITAGHKIQFDAIPFHGLKHLGSKINNYEDYTKLSENIASWQQLDSAGAHFDVEHIMESAALMRDKKTDEIYSFKYINYLLQNDLVEKAIAHAEFLPLTKDTIDILIILAQKGLDEGCFKNIESLFFRRTLPSGGWSSHTGEAPPALIEIENNFIEMNKKVQPGPVSNLIDKCIKSVERDIKDHLDRDEEFLAERG